MQRLQRHPTVQCPQCNKQLLLWPDRGPEFTCDFEDCTSQGKGIVNTGINRYNCFVCDYDACMACLSKPQDASPPPYSAPPPSQPLLMTPYNAPSAPPQYEISEML